MNVIKKEAIKFYKSSLIGFENKEEKSMLYNSILEALNWAFSNYEKDIERDYFSNLSLDQNMRVVSDVLKLDVSDVLSSPKRDCVLAKKIFVYISSKKHSYDDISKFILKRKYSTIEMRNSIESSINLNDIDIIKIISKVSDHIQNK